jgi:[ribosomal protein S5]-alanine N-acetyltransferase
MSIIGLAGERVRLVPIDRALHLDNALRWLNDPAVIASLELNLGVTRRQEEAFFDRVEASSEREIVWAIQDEHDEHVGFIGLNSIHWRHRLATGGLVLGEKSAWGRGLATDAVQVRSRFVFETLGLHRLEGHTINPAMKRVYEKAGYHREGTFREAVWREGSWRDADAYSLLDRDYFAAKNLSA